MIPYRGNPRTRVVGDLHLHPPLPAQAAKPRPHLPVPPTDRHLQWVTIIFGTPCPAHAQLGPDGGVAISGFEHLPFTGVAPSPT